MIKVYEENSLNNNGIEYSDMTVGKFKDSIERIFLDKFPLGKVVFDVYQQYHGGCIIFRLFTGKTRPNPYTEHQSFYEVISPTIFYVFIGDDTHRKYGSLKDYFDATDDNAKLPEDLHIALDHVFADVISPTGYTAGRVKFNDFDGNPYEIIHKFDLFVNQLYKEVSKYY